MGSDRSQFRIDRIAPGENRDDWERALRGFDGASARVLKREGGSAVYWARMLDRDVVVKVRELRGPADRLKVAIGAGRGRRHWDGAEWLAAHGVATARPYVLATQRGGECVREWLVMEALPGKTLLQHIADGDLSVRQEHAISRQLGRQMTVLRLAHRVNRDHKPSNILLVPSREGLTPAIIDCVAIVRGGWLDCRMLHALAIEPTGLGILPRRTLRARTIYEMVKADYESDAGLKGASPGQRRGVRNLIWNRVIESVRRHTDPTPNVNPLAQSSR